MPDIVAYKTGKKVLWGGHSYGFKMLEPIFPVLKMRLGEVVKKYGINYILLFKEYLPDFENFSEKELSIRKLEEDGEYVLYEVN
ncbi:TPA: hypothetical protein EYP70_01595 [Candidatus Bathyarchaeota archaeon]|nr:hypothetical protein [Candidatus Bathyarchaeota archaeon]